MKLLFLLASYTAIVASAAKSGKRKGGCEITERVGHSFYGSAEESGAVEYSECGRITAGGRGTYESPLTMAAAPGAFSKCEIVFVPYLLKYVRFEDICTSCITEWAKGKVNMRIWTGDDVSGGSEQAACERDLTPGHGLSVIRNPGHDYRIDTTPLYSRGTEDACRSDHRYSLINNAVFCYGRRDKTAGRRRKKQQPVQQEVIESVVEEDVEEEVERPEVLQRRAILNAASAAGEALPIVL